MVNLSQVIGTKIYQLPPAIYQILDHPYFLPKPRLNWAIYYKQANKIKLHVLKAYHKKWPAAHSSLRKFPTNLNKNSDISLKTRWNFSFLPTKNVAKILSISSPPSLLPIANINHFQSEQWEWT